MKHSQQMIDAFVREWSRLHAKAIEETINDNREDARFYENFQSAEELVNVNKIIKNFLFRIEKDRYGFGHTLNYKDTCRMLGAISKHREILLKSQKNAKYPIVPRFPHNLAARDANTTQSQPNNPQPSTGTTGTPVPVAEESKTVQNPNKTTKTPTLTGPQKNQSVPVPDEKEPSNLAKRHGLLRSSAAFHTNTNEPPNTTNASALLNSLEREVACYRRKH